MKNVFKKEVVFSTSCYQLEDYIKSIYGGDPPIAAIEGGDGDQVVSNNIRKEDIHSYRHEEELANEIAEGNYSRVNGVHEILLTLLRDGHIEEGNHVIYDV